MNILVVDDNRLLNRFMVVFFRSKGHTCSALTDGTRAEEWLSMNPCDVVVTGIDMPKINGIDLIAQLRPKYPKLPIIVFTGRGYDEGMMQAARRAGADGYVSKGLGPSEIYAEVIRLSGVPVEK